MRKLIAEIFDPGTRYEYALRSTFCRSSRDELLFRARLCNADREPGFHPLSVHPNDELAGRSAVARLPLDSKPEVAS
jgi:hypothetical protein